MYDIFKVAHIIIAVGSIRTQDFSRVGGPEGYLGKSLAY